MKRSVAVEWSLNLAAVEFGVSRDTIRRGLRANDVADKKTYTTKEIFDALNGGDLEAEKILKTREERISLARENRIADRELVPYSDAEAVFIESHIPVVNALDALADYASRVNPQDPELAAIALRALSEEIKSRLRSDFNQMLLALDTQRDTQKK